MVFEMTGAYECILPLMVVSAIADLTAEKMNHKPIYAKIVVNQYKNADVNLSDKTTIQDIMTQNVKTFKNNAKYQDKLEVMEQEGHNAYPICDKKDRLSGIITKSDIEDVLVDNKMKSITVSRILDTNPVTVYPDDNLYTAYYRLHENSTEWAIVINKEQKVLGIVTRKDIINN